MLPAGLLERLADGRDHTRASLCESLSLRHDELDDQIDALESSGLQIVTVDDDALRLAERIAWLDRASIEAVIAADSHKRIESIDLKFETQSTNRHLLDGPPPPHGMSRIAIAEYQTAGRGRRGRRWTMPPGSGLALSASWRFGQEPDNLQAFSLGAGAAVRRAIYDLTALEVGLKWPNDLFADGGKLGGILVELAQLQNGEMHVVAGVGVNVRMPATLLATVSDYRHGARDLATSAPQWAADRAALAARLTERLIELFVGYESTGFAPYRAEWLAANVLYGKAVEVSSYAGTACGTVVDVGADGALIIETAQGQQQRIISADVTIRAWTDDRD